MKQQNQPARLMRALWQLLLCAMLVQPAWAHDPGLSNIELRLAGGQLIAFLAFNRAEIAPLVTIDSNGDGKYSAEEFAAARPKLEALANTMLEVTANGQRLSVLSSKAELDDFNDVLFYITFLGDAALPIKAKSLLLPKLARGHRHVISLRGEQGQTINEQILDVAHDTFDSSANATSASANQAAAFSFSEFVKLGIEHIFTGYDHLLFLFALLIVGGSFKEAAKIITSFTLAHSLTLAVATLGWVSLPSKVVEPLIAASIVYVGIENLVRHNYEKRWLLTWCFGLIHGFGFASVLRELGIGVNGGGVALPLFSFNLGVEIGQISIAILVLPLIWHFHKSPIFMKRYVPVCSVLVALAGAYWLIQRTLL
ncbi:MAG: HupE/UreJ family protein [Acidobacteria bacterium]|nr:HupE/UreJ family protein [Acidobacteriota bacterium]MBI3425354.1 HupE/UreJ family protein [Acidobacteriota bacterium]